MMEHFDEIPLQLSLLPLNGIGTNKTYPWS